MDEVVKLMVAQFQKNIDILHRLDIPQGCECELFYDDDEESWWVGWSSPRGYNGDWFNSAEQAITWFLKHPPK